MTRFALKGICGLVALVALAGCENLGQQMGGPSDGVTPQVTFQRDPMYFYFDGQIANTYLDSAPHLYAGLAKFGIPRPSGASDLKWIERIRGEQGGPPSGYLKGLGGIVSRAFLQGAEQTTSKLPPSNYEQAIELVAHGEIIDYRYNSDGSGWLEVITYYNLSDGPPQRPARTAAYKWRVTVDPGGFTVVDKTPEDDPNYDPNNVFPGTIPINAAKAQNLYYKLWAKGTAIKVQSVERDMNVMNGVPNWQPMPESNPHFAPLYEPSDDACIDMMFALPPPEVLPAGIAPPLYCLGRCDQPLIINTK